MEAADSVYDNKGSISLRAQATGSGYRFFFFDDDDDDESYFDLNLEKTGDSDEFEPQMTSFPPLPAAGISTQNSADELFRYRRILPRQGGDDRDPQQVPERAPQEKPRPLIDESGGGVNLEAQLVKTHRSRSNRPSMVEKKMPQRPTGTRKASKRNNSMIEFLVKFPSKKIRSNFMSIIRSYGSLPLQGHKHIAMHFSRWFAAGKKKNPRSGGTSNSNVAAGASAGASPWRTSEVELDENVVGSILAAFNFSVGRQSTSRSGIQVSPRQLPFPPRDARKEQGMGHVVEERSSSITSAIAHCKMSY